MKISLEKIEKRRLQLKRLLDSKSKNFDERNKMNIKPCVYAICEGSNVIYVGFTKRALKMRLRELLTDPRSHILHKKLKKEFKSTEKVKRFLNGKCKFKALRFKNEKEARCLEHFAVGVLNPKYND